MENDKRHRGPEPQGEEIERALILQAGVDRAKPTTETVPIRLAEENPGGEKRKRCANARGERHDQRAPQEAEDRSACERHDRRERERKRGDDNVDSEKNETRGKRIPSPKILDRRLLRPEVFEPEILTEVEREKSRDQAEEKDRDEQPPTRHGTRRFRRRARRRPPERPSARPAPFRNPDRQRCACDRRARQASLRARYSRTGPSMRRGRSARARLRRRSPRAARRRAPASNACPRCASRGRNACRGNSAFRRRRC